jgi:hypothetical protein
MPSKKYIFGGKKITKNKTLFSTSRVMYYFQCLCGALSLTNLSSSFLRSKSVAVPSVLPATPFPCPPLRPSPAAAPCPCLMCPSPAACRRPPLMCTSSLTSHRSLAVLPAWPYSSIFFFIHRGTNSFVWCYEDVVVLQLS